MYKNYIDNLTILSKKIITVLIILILFITKSYYMILFVSVLLIFLILLNEKSVKEYVKIFKSYLLILLFFLLAYIIVINENTVIFIYKSLVAYLFIINYYINMDFYMLHLSIYSSLRILNLFNVDSEKVSFYLAKNLYYFNLIFTSKDKIIEKQLYLGNKKHGLKYRLIPTVFYADNEINKLTMNLNTNNYKLKKYRTNIKSVISVLLFLLLFILTIYKTSGNMSR